MDEQRQDEQLEPMYNSSVPIQDIALVTSREQWMVEIGGERGSEKSMQAARHDDDDYYHLPIFEFFAPVLTDGFPLEFEKQQVSSSRQDSSQFSGRS